MNIENKRQAATILLAVGLGCVAVFLMGNHIQNAITKQTKTIAMQYQEKNSLVEGEIANIKNGLNQLSKNQKDLAEQQRRPRQQPEPKKQNEKQNFSKKTPFGKRALTIKIDSLSAVGGLVRAGDLVDVIAYLKPQTKKDDKNKKSKEEKEKELITVLFQNIEVLAVGTDFNSIADLVKYTAQQDAQFLNVTLALTPEEAGLVTFVQENGRLKLSLRSPNEQKKENLAAATWETLSNYVLKNQGTKLDIIPPPPKSGNVKTESPYVQVFRAGEEAEE